MDARGPGIVNGDIRFITTANRGWFCNGHCLQSHGQN
jgi:hypothetical protein